MAKIRAGARLGKAEKQQRLDELKKIMDEADDVVVRATLDNTLDSEEAVEAERRLVKARWEEFELTGEAIPHAEVEAWMERKFGIPRDGIPQDEEKPELIPPGSVPGLEF